MSHHHHLDPVPGTRAAAGASLRVRVGNAVLGNLLRLVRLLGHALDGFSPNP